MAASVVASVALPISNNFSFAPSMDAYGKLSEYGKLGAWSPLSLFAASEVGAWYDPSDLTTMFQDAAGTIPVTADGQPVGLILDKSKGLVLGPELVTNTGPFTATTGWDDQKGNAPLSVSAGNLLATPTNTATCRTDTQISTVVGKWYSLSVTVNQFSGIGQTVAILSSRGGAPVSGTGTVGTVGVNKIIFLASTTSVWLTVGSNISTIGIATIISSATVKELPGNHATQATAASRPLYKTDGTYHWLQFDGVDDSLSTGAIDFTSTDKMGVFVGAEFVTSADSTFITEFSANALGNAGAFYLKSTDSGSNYLQAATNTTSYLYGNSSVISRPSTKVIAQLIDTSIAPDQPANQLKLRVNASPETLSLTGYMPAGNFGTYPLYIASRAGVSYYFGGRIYSMIIRGALSTPQEITDTETWVNSKTGAY